MPFYTAALSLENKEPDFFWSDSKTASGCSATICIEVLFEQKAMESSSDKGPSSPFSPVADGLYRVDRDWVVFKGTMTKDNLKTKCPCVTTLLLPKDTTVRLDPAIAAAKTEKDIRDPPKNGNRKCRASQAKVISNDCACQIPWWHRAKWVGGEWQAKETQSWWDPDFTYPVGRTVRPRKDFDRDATEECGSGVHFYNAWKEAAEF